MRRFVLDTALVLGVLLLLGQRAAVQAPWAMACAALGLALVWRRASRPARWLAVMAFALGLWRATSAVRAGDEARVVIRDALGPPTRCTGRGVIVSSPTVRADTTRATVALSDVSCEGRPLPPLRARLYGISGHAARGDLVSVVTQLGAAQLFHDPDLPDPRPAAARGGTTASGGVVDVTLEKRAWSLPSLIDRARASVRDRIERSYGAEAAPLARALVLGEEDLAEADGEAFRRSGLAHLLAVSGTHLVLVVLSAVAGLRALLARWYALAARVDVGRIAAGGGVALAFLYADFAGGSGSALRAAWMLAAVLSARALGRRGAAARALGLSALAMGLVDPLVAFDGSFLLSIAATAGLLTLSRPIDGWLSARLPGVLAKVASPVAASLAASIACAPFLAAMSPTLPLSGLVANVIAVPIGEAAALPVCLLHALLGFLPWAERGAAVVGGGALLSVRAVARFSASLVWGALPVPPPTELQGTLAFLGVAAAAGAASLLSRRLRLLVAGAALLLAEAGARRQGIPHGQLRVTFLDVAQGDAALVDLPDGQAMLIDGGGLVGSPVDVGRAVLMPTLRARRRSRLDVVALSHPHPDHFGGLQAAVAGVEVGALWDTGQGEQEGAGSVYAELLRSLRARGVPVQRPDTLCGEHALGGAIVSVLAPCPSFEPLSGANDNSLVIRIAFGRRAVLFVGDAEHEAEARLLGARAVVKADVLKLGHHGSRTSTTPGFLAAVSPSLGILSCGVRNRFGHPHPNTLATLAAAGVPARRTDRGGGVTWTTDGDHMWVSEPLP